MTLQEIQAGTPFIYKNIEYKIFSDDLSPCIVRNTLNTYVANVKEMTKSSIKVFTYVLNKRVSVTIKIKDCQPIKLEE